MGIGFEGDLADVVELGLIVPGDELHRRSKAGREGDDVGEKHCCVVVVLFSVGW